MLLMLGGLALIIAASLPGAQPRALAQGQPTNAPAARPTADHEQFLPVVTRNAPWQAPFGIQSDFSLTNTALLSATVDLGSGWVRLGPISWRRLQPTEGAAIRWNLLASFERELLLAKQHGITPEVIIYDSPAWATINKPFVTSCGAIRSDKFGAFASFMGQLVARYSDPKYDVRHWELGNEVDVDPSLVAPNNGFGCWGDIKDPYYGGRHYGEMLKVVAPAIRAANPAAKIWFGGLLLDSPNTSEAGRGRPELFLQGALLAGAAPHFDILPYHAYTPYLNKIVDPDNPPGTQWGSRGGRVLGKARFLRELMQPFGVDKPLFLNETALMCPDQELPYSAWCNPPQVSFYSMQANYLVRAFTRALSARVIGVLWYSLNGPGWRYTGLLGNNNSHTLAYDAFKVLSGQLRNTQYLGPLSLGKGIEAYEFGRFGQRVRVLWAIEDQSLAVFVPKADFIAAAGRDGKSIAPIASGDSYLFVVGFDAIYLTLKEPTAP